MEAGPEDLHDALLDVDRHRRAGGDAHPQAGTGQLARIDLVEDADELGRHQEGVRDAVRL